MQKVGVVGNPVKIRTGYHSKINIQLYSYIKGLKWFLRRFWMSIRKKIR